jgi:hypothetical protein
VVIAHIAEAGAGQHFRGRLAVLDRALLGETGSAAPVSRVVGWRGLQLERLNTVLAIELVVGMAGIQLWVPCLLSDP